MAWKLLFTCYFLMLLSLGARAQLFPEQLLEGKKKTIIPFEYHQHFIVIPVLFQGILPLKFIFDTGAEYSLLFKREYTDVLGFSYDKKIPILGADQLEVLSALVCRKVQLNISGLPSLEHDILVLEKELFRVEQMAGTRIDGLIGTSLFRNFVVVIDYRKRHIVLWDPSAFEAPDDFVPITAHFKHNKAYTFANTAITPRDSIDAELLFDTGAGLPLLIHSNTHPALQLPDSTISGHIGIGLGGLMSGYIGRIHQFQLGPHHFHNLITSFHDLDSTLISTPTKSRHGIIGNQLLSKFTLTIDFPRNQLYLKKNRNFKRPIRYDKSGLTIFAVGPQLNEFVVNHVMPNSPAHRAGIRPGDRITHLGWRGPNCLSLEKLTRKLQGKEDKKITLRILRQGEKMKKSFYLKDLL